MRELHLIKLIQSLTAISRHLFITILLLIMQLALSLSFSTFQNFNLLINEQEIVLKGTFFVKFT